MRTSVAMACLTGLFLCPNGAELLTESSRTSQGRVWGEGREPLVPLALSALELSPHHRLARTAHVKSEQLESNEFSGTESHRLSSALAPAPPSPPSQATRQEIADPQKKKTATALTAPPP